MLEPFSLLFDEDSRRERSLPPELYSTYAGDWHLPDISGRPYIYANFALSRDGRISFNEPGHLGGGDVSGFNAHDQWLMALLRARADAVVVGDNTLRLEPEHLWTSAYIYPQEAPVFEALRQAENRKPQPLQVFLSLEGEFDPAASVFAQRDMSIIIATTARGFERAQDLRCAADLTVLKLGEESVDVTHFARVLHADFAVKTLLCEGGPRVYGGFIAAGLIDDEFLALCPSVIGQAARARPGLIEGVAFSAVSHPKSLPLSLRRAGHHLFLRSRYSYPLAH